MRQKIKTKTKESCCICNGEIEFRKRDEYDYDPECYDYISKTTYTLYWHKRCSLLEEVKEAQEILVCSLCKKQLGFIEYSSDINASVFCGECKSRVGK
jgi:hypothetical protein